MSFVSNELGIDISASFQEVQFQANTIEDSILYVDNLHPMEFFLSSREIFPSQSELLSVV